MQVSILADKKVDFRLIKLLRNEGHKVFSVLEARKGITDLQGIELAKRIDAIIQTLAKDESMLTKK